MMPNFDGARAMVGPLPGLGRRPSDSRALNAHHAWRRGGIALMVMWVHTAAAQTQIDFASKTPLGLVGNGTSVVKVRPSGFEFIEGGSARGRFRLVVNGEPHEVQADDARSAFFPGGVSYRLTLQGMAVEILHGATPASPYMVGVRVRNAKGPVELELESQGEPAVVPAGRTRIPLTAGEGHVILSAGRAKLPGSWQALRDRFEAPYRDGLVLRTPDPAVDRAVPFNHFLMRLGFNGRLHVCELFRWRDVWSRDLGSGLAPGAMIDGDVAAARTTIDYDLRRYAAANPRGLKVTDDPSQGGSAEGTAWLTRAVWRYYLLTGDRDFLVRAAAVLRPWLQAWIDRDADDRGLLIDVTEWMDHSRFLLFPDGARALYSNVLFVDLLRNFANIERTLGHPEAAGRLEGVRTRFVRGINAALWNETAGRYDNLVLWGARDERSSSDGNALAVLSGVVPADRVPRVLTAVRQTNWRRAGSVTITPPMTHVDAHNDQNVKVWPWWNAVEARARFLNGDVEGGLRLLEAFARTLDDDRYPGLVEELLTPEGVSEGGPAFVTAAGAYQDAVFEGLLGIQIMEPGRSRLRVSPNVPADWATWRATVPLPQGRLMLVQADGKLQIRVTDPRVKVIEAPSAALVRGARHAALSERELPALLDSSPPAPVAPPPPTRRRAATFVESGLPAPALAGLPHRQVSAEQLLTLDPESVRALVVPGNALPRKTRSGADLQGALGRFLDHGGALVFWGATMHDRQTMGEHGGVIDWYEYRPRIGYRALEGWTFRPSPDGGEVDHVEEYGLKQGWHAEAQSDTGWTDVTVPRVWEDHPSSRYTGWEWFRAPLYLPAEARGRPLVLTLGRINSQDWTYINGVLVGADKGNQVFRSYPIKPGDAAYAALHFGGDNVVAIQVLYAGPGGGLYADVPTIGIESDELAWIPLDAETGAAREYPERHGVVSWGRGDFFNSWETSRGAFGFAIEGHGVEFAGPLAGLPPLEGATRAAFTDFAISKPWLFQPLAWTRTHRQLLYPDRGERYPVAARIVNTETGGEFILIPESIAESGLGLEVMRRLGIEVDDAR